MNRRRFLGLLTSVPLVAVAAKYSLFNPHRVFFDMGRNQKLPSDAFKQRLLAAFDHGFDDNCVFYMNRDQEEAYLAYRESMMAEQRKLEKQVQQITGIPYHQVHGTHLNWLGLKRSIYPARLNISPLSA